MTVRLEEAAICRNNPKTAKLNINTNTLSPKSFTKQTTLLGINQQS
jgi:hypothetical protein